MCGCICFFYFFSFYWHNFFWAKSMLNLMENGHGCLFLFGERARSLQNLVYAEELKGDKERERGMGGQSGQVRICVTT